MAEFSFRCPVFRVTWPTRMGLGAYERGVLTLSSALKGGGHDGGAAGEPQGVHAGRMMVCTFTDLARLKVSCGGRHPQRCRLAVWLILSLLIAPGFGEQAQRLDDASVRTVFFYSPETNINNFQTLKEEFDNFLTRHGQHKFQPFCERADFERALKEDKRGIFLMSSWHYREVSMSGLWRPVLVGLRNERATHTHVIYGRAGEANLAELKGATIATAGSPEYTSRLLYRILGDDQKALIESFKLLVVPKDIDALMAVDFNVAAAAIATERGAAKLENINPKQRQRLQALSSAEESLLPMLVCLPEPDAQMLEVIQTFNTMAKDEEGLRRLRMLGLDGFRAIRPEELKEVLDK